MTVLGTCWGYSGPATFRPAAKTARKIKSDRPFMPGRATASASSTPLTTHPTPPPSRASRKNGSWFTKVLGLRNDPAAWKSLKAAVKFFNAILSFMFSAGDMFGSHGGGGGHWSSEGGGVRRSASGGDGPEYDDDDDDDDGDEYDYRGLENTGSFEGLEQHDGYGIRPPRDVGPVMDFWNPSLINKKGPVKGKKKMLNFSTRYSVAASLANSTRIEQYMQLPFDQYSLLDQSFISRVQDNVFRFMVPANELVGLQTVPVVDVKVELNEKEKSLSISSISSRLVSRAPDGTILGTYDMDMLTNNSLNFSVQISYAEDRWVTPVGPRRLAMNIRQSLFRGQQKGNMEQQQSLEMSKDSSSSNDAIAAPPAESRGGGGRPFGSGPRSQRRLRCSARVHVGVLVPPPFSLLPRMMARQGGSLILGYIVTNLVNRFLDLLIEDYYKFAAGDESRTSTSSASGGLLGYQPDRFQGRVLETEGEGELAHDDESSDDDEPVIDYII